MHLIDNQYLKEITTNQKVTDMHDLYVIYAKVKRRVKLAAKDYLDKDGDVMFYSNKPKMSDLEIISLAITAESLAIDSENFLFSKIRKDYSKNFPNLIHRTRYNARRKRLSEWILYCADMWGDEMKDDNGLFIVDSIPFPVCKICRAPGSTVCRKEGDQVKAKHGYDSTIKQWFCGYRLHLIVSSSGVYQEMRLLPANCHDLDFLKELQETHLEKCLLIGDKVYQSRPVQMTLFSNWEIDLSVPYRVNQKDYEEYPYHLKIERKKIETIFSQYCDDLMLKRNYAKSYDGLESRVHSKIAAMTFKQYWNYLHGNKISRTKHALAA